MSLRTLPRTRLGRTGLMMAAALVVGASPAHADARPGPAGAGLPVGVAAPPVPHPGVGAAPQATIEDEEDFCGYLTGVYDYKPAYFTVRTINCGYSTTFVKAVYARGGYGLCLPVPARSSRHLGGSLFKPVEKSQLC